ncbi:hypothetical protein UC8_09750 [Roseimaritima ulvae]|uniref:Uncharacterized protein n=1 Tax=Roseimaritima ulvae TaxID=980254 RepID=A0A5B9QJD3_9BACT|nr:hypothetical protein UC8_09750 [Roseimaritima ulvae]
MFRLLQGFFASMSLERKSVLLFVSALVPLMFAAFWVVQLLAGPAWSSTAPARSLAISAPPK